MPKRKSRNQSLKQRVKALEMRLGRAESSAVAYADVADIERIRALWARFGQIAQAKDGAWSLNADGTASLGSDLVIQVNGSARVGGFGVALKNHS